MATGQAQPKPLMKLVHDVARTRPLLLIGTVGFEREFDRAYTRRTEAQLWQLPQSGTYVISRTIHTPTRDARGWPGEASGKGLRLSSAILASGRLRWASLGCVRSAPQLLHGLLSVLKTVELVS